jgi:hypothetical protein
LQSRLTSCVRRLFYEAKEARQAYDFYSNSKVTNDALLKPHIQNTVERIKKSDCEYILAIQDTTILNYTSHKAKMDIGRIRACRQLTPPTSSRGLSAGSS